MPIPLQSGATDMPGTSHPRRLATLRAAARCHAPIVVFDPLKGGDR